MGCAAALLRLFDGFTLHSVHVADEALPTLVHADLMVPGYGGLIVEPHVRPDAVAARAERGAGLELHRVVLEPGAINEPVGLAVEHLLAPILVPA